MANEITASISLKMRKEVNSSIFREFIRSLTNKKFTMSGNEATAGWQTIGFAAHELLAISADIATAGWALFYNTDPTNYVELGIDTGPGTFRVFAKLLAGEFALIPVATTAVYAQANTAACVLEYAILER